MKLVIGLGNIGSKYNATRHNVGFEVVERLGKKLTEEKFQQSDKFDALILRVGEVLLVEPTTLMNRSGQAVAKLVNFYKVDLGDVYVVHDDLDIELGEFKIQRGKGPKVHNGVASVERSLGETQFWRVRIGVDSRTAQQRSQLSGVDYVLGKFSREEEKNKLEVIEAVVEELGRRLL